MFAVSGPVTHICNRAIHPDNVLKSKGCWYEDTSRVFAVTGPVTYMWNGAIHRYNVLKSEGYRYRAVSCVFAGAPPRCRTAQYRRPFIPLLVSLRNDLADTVFDGVGLACFKSRANVF